MISKKDLLNAYEFRHACKTFDPDKQVSEEAFELILEAGRLSPCSFGLEPWRFVVIQNQALRDQLKATVWGAQGHLPTASYFVAIMCRKQDMRFDSPYIERFMREVQKHPEDAIKLRLARYQRFQEHDMKLLDSPRALFDWACKQAYIALGNMMTAAAMLGIDSCAIEGYDQAATEKILHDAGVLDTEQFGLAVMVAFGYRINPQPVKTRQPAEAVVTWIR